MDKPAINVELFNGPLYIGSIIASCLFACFVLQTSRYFAHENKDKWPVTSLVLFVLLMELCGVVGMIHAIYGVLCFTSVGPNPTFAFPISGAITPIFSALTTISTQLFFAWRINALGKSRNKRWPKLISGIICVLAMAQLGAYITIMVQGRRFRQNPKKFPMNRHPMLLRLSSALVCDFLMSAGLISLLWPYRHGVRRSSRNMVNSLIRSTIENGSITAFVATMQLIFYLTRSKDLIHVAIAYITGRLHANVLIGSLNSRRRLREADEANTTFTLTGGSNPAVRRTGHRVDRLFHNALGVAAGVSTTATVTTAKSGGGASSGRRHSLSMFRRSGRAGETEDSGSIHLTTVNISFDASSAVEEGDRSVGSDNLSGGVAGSVGKERVEDDEEDEEERMKMERKADLERGL